MRHSRLVMPMLALTMAFASGAVSPVAADTLEGYGARVEQALIAVRDAGTSVRTDTAADAVAEKVRALLPPGERVDAGGRQVAADSSVARDMAQRLASADTPVEREAAAADLEAYLASVDSAIGGPSDVVEHDPAVLAALLEAQVVDTRVDLGEILRGYLDRVLVAFNDWWAGLAAGGPVGRVSQVVVVAAVGIALLVAVWSMLRALRPRIADRDERAAADDGAMPVVAAAEGLPADALGHAEGLAARGRLREAVRALYGGAARVLVDSGLVPQARTRTGAELLSDAGRSAPEVRGPLAELTRAFEAAWYGHVDPGADGWDAAHDAYGRTLGAAGRSQER